MEIAEAVMLSVQCECYVDCAVLCYVDCAALDTYLHFKTTLLLMLTLTLTLTLFAMYPVI